MKKAIITGHTSGIGRALAELMKKRGYEVIGMSRSNGYDVSKLETWEKIARIIAEKGKVDVLVLNAGIARFTAEEEFKIHKELVGTNLLGVYYGLWYAPRLVKEGGTIAVTASSAAYHPDPCMPLYCAIKTAVVELVKAFCKMYAGKYRVFAISPGFTRTNLGGQGGYIPPELLERVPMKRAMEPEECARYYLLLIEEFDFLNGAEVRIDGGETA